MMIILNKKLKKRLKNLFLYIIIIIERKSNKIKGKDKVNTMTRVEMDKRMKGLEQREFVIWMIDK